MSQRNSIEAQCSRLLKRLRKGPCTTIQARHEEDVFAPGPRIYDLRHKHGYNIRTNWTIARNPGGRNHRVAEYILLPGEYKGSNQHGEY